MKRKRNILTAIAAIAMIFALAACSESIAPEDRLGTITFGENSSRAVGTVVKYSNEVEDMHWYYKATKQDDGYTTGDTGGKLFAVSADGSAGLSGRTLNNNFSYGLWNIELMGFKTTTDVTSAGAINTDGGGVQYKATIANFLVDKGANYAKAEIQFGENPTTKIEFGEISFSVESALTNISTSSKLTLSVTDGENTIYTDKSGDEDPKYSIAAPTISVDSTKGVVTVTSKQLNYLQEGSSIVGNHTMNFVLSQELSNDGNITIEAALYTLKFTVQAGTTTTISGTLIKNDETGSILIDSVQDVPELTLSRVLEVKNVDSSSNSAIITSAKTITYGDMEVIYPSDAKITTTATGLTVDEGKATGTADAKIGLEYLDSSMPTDKDSKTVTIAGANSCEKYELTLSASTDNTVLLTIKKNIGANREISAIYHEKAALAKYSDLAAEKQATTESYEYDNTTGVLTLRLFHASELFIITKEYVAEADGVRYYSLDSAIKSASSGATIKLLRDCSGSGIGTKSSDGTDRESLIIDFNKHTYTMNSGAVGSSGTENQAMHWEVNLKSIILKNGTFKVAENVSGLKMGMQNYTTFIAEDMTLDFSNIEPLYYGNNLTGDDAKYIGLERLVWGNNKDGNNGYEGIMLLKNTIVKTNDKSNYGICASNGTLTLENSTIEGFASFNDVGGKIIADSTSSITKGCKAYFATLECKTETVDGKTTYTCVEKQTTE